MIDLRLYRVALLPALVAVVVVLFSLQSIPDPLEPGLTPTTFDGDRAAALAARITREHPERTPGAEGDAALADLVSGRFARVRSGETSEQRFESTFDGEDVELRNVILTLPGESQRVLMVLAGRDSARGAGPASSAAATAALIEVAAGLGSTEHSNTIVVVSTDGASDGATGAREFLDGYPAPELIDAAVVISQPGSGDPATPHVIVPSTGEQSAAIQLVRTAERSVADQAGRRSGLEGTFWQLSRLALPSGLGEQAPLLEEGIDTVAISSAGEPPLDRSEDESRDLSAESLGAFGRSALDLVLTLDRATAPLEHGPETHVRLAGNLVPGWAISLLALSLLLPGGIAAVDALARATRRRAGARRSVVRAASFALPFLAGLGALYLLALPGLMPDPRFPFDPARFGIGARAIAVALLIAIVVATAARATRELRSPDGAQPASLAAGIGMISFGAVAMLWLANPFLGLLAVPLVHAWIPAARADAPPPRLALAAIAGLALLPLLAAQAEVLTSFDSGLAGPWHVALMVADGQIGPVTATMAAVLAGALAAFVSLRAPQATPDTPGGQPGWTEVVSGQTRRETINGEVTPSA